jgi:holliday junction DNA helicase RuvA
MIEQLKGRVAHKTPLLVIVDCGGIGYGVHVSARTGDLLPELGNEVTLLTHLVVREDALTLFGFAHLQEKEVFLRMIEVNGIGPKMAQRILSSVSPADLLGMIAREDHQSLSRIKGIGKKTSEMLVLALKDKALQLAAIEGGTATALLPASEQEAVLALHTLGVKDPVARKAVATASETLGANADVGKLIAEALRHV